MRLLKEVPVFGKVGTSLEENIDTTLLRGRLQLGVFPQ